MRHRNDASKSAIVDVPPPESGKCISDSRGGALTDGYLERGYLQFTALTCFVLRVGSHSDGSGLGRSTSPADCMADGLVSAASLPQAVRPNFAYPPCRVGLQQEGSAPVANPGCNPERTAAGTGGGPPVPDGPPSVRSPAVHAPMWRQSRTRDRGVHFAPHAAFGAYSCVAQLPPSERGYLPQRVCERRTERGVRRGRPWGNGSTTRRARFGVLLIPRMSSRNSPLSGMTADTFVLVDGLGPISFRSIPASPAEWAVSRITADRGVR
jgi:hypothetical protein